VVALASPLCWYGLYRTLQAGVRRRGGGQPRVHSMRMRFIALACESEIAALGLALTNPAWLPVPALSEAWVIVSVGGALIAGVSVLAIACTFGTMRI